MKAGVYHLPGSPSAFLKPASTIFFSHSQGCHLYTPASGHFLLCSFCPVKAGMHDLFSLFFSSFSSLLSIFFFFFSILPLFLVSSMFALLSLPPEHQNLPEGRFYMYVALVFIFDDLVFSTAIQGVSLECVTLEARGLFFWVSCVTIIIRDRKFLAECHFQSTTQIANWYASNLSEKKDPVSDKHRRKEI